MPELGQPPISPALVTPAQSANSITSDRGLLNQQMATLTDNVSTQQDGLVTALDAIAAAINAKPSS